MHWGVHNILMHYFYLYIFVFFLRNTLFIYLYFTIWKFKHILFLKMPIHILKHISKRWREHLHLVISIILIKKWTIKKHILERNHKLILVKTFHLIVLLIILLHLSVSLIIIHLFLFCFNLFLFFYVSFFFQINKKKN